MTGNPKVSQNLKLLAVVVEYICVLCSVCLFQAGCSKCFVLLLGLLESNKYSYGGQYLNKFLKVGSAETYTFSGISDP